jgi:transcriptional regulator of heat shock response
MIASSYHSEEGDSGIIAIIGPKRMQYGRNKSLIDFVRKIFGGKENLVVLLMVSGGALMIVI